MGQDLPWLNRSGGPRAGAMAARRVGCTARSPPAPPRCWPRSWRCWGWSPCWAMPWSSWRSPCSGASARREPSSSSTWPSPTCWWVSPGAPGGPRAAGSPPSSVRRRLLHPPLHPLRADRRVEIRQGLVQAVAGGGLPRVHCLRLQHRPHQPGQVHLCDPSGTRGDGGVWAFGLSLEVFLGVISLCRRDICFSLLHWKSHALDKLKKSYPAEAEHLPQHRAMQLLRPERHPRSTTGHRGSSSQRASYRAQKGMTRNAVLKMIMVWIAAFLLYGPAILSWEYIAQKSILPEGECHAEFFYNWYFLMIASTIEFFTPFITVTYLNLSIYLNIRKRTSLRNENLPPGQEDCEMSVQGEKKEHTVFVVKPANRHKHKMRANGLSPPKKASRLSLRKLDNRSLNLNAS